MPHMELREHKKLKLTNVLFKKCTSDDVRNTDKNLMMISNYMQSKDLLPVGPLIAYSSGIKGVGADNRPLIDSYIIVQLSQASVCVEHPYKFESSIEVKDCIMVRIVDTKDKLVYASMKMQLFAYENGMDLTGETYTIILNEENDVVTADVFMPVKQGV